MELKRKLQILGMSLIALMTLNTGCYYDKVLPPEPEGEISYSQDMQPFFDASCVGCHSEGTGIPLNLEAEVSYTNLFDGGYIDVENPEASSLYTHIAPGGGMEIYATDNDVAITLKWIQQGAKNN